MQVEWVETFVAEQLAKAEVSIGFKLIEGVPELVPGCGIDIEEEEPSAG